MTDETYDHREVAEEQAAAKGCVVVEPGEDDLFVDVDDAASEKLFHANFARVLPLLPGATYEKRPSPSAREERLHVVVKLGRPAKDASERILLQALLGSDLVRECLSWVRMTKGSATPTLFFEKKA